MGAPCIPKLLQVVSAFAALSSAGDLTGCDFPGKGSFFAGLPRLQPGRRVQSTADEPLEHVGTDSFPPAKTLASPAAARRLLVTEFLPPRGSCGMAPSGYLTELQRAIDSAAKEHCMLIFPPMVYLIDDPGGPCKLRQNSCVAVCTAACVPDWPRVGSGRSGVFRTGRAKCNAAWGPNRRLPRPMA